MSDPIPTHAVLMIVTGQGSEAEGVWFEDFADPYIFFLMQQCLVILASPKGGEVQIDPESLKQLDAMAAYEHAKEALRETKRIDSKLIAEPFEALYIVGGHSALQDYSDHVELKRIVKEFFAQKKVVATLGDGFAALVGVEVAGEPLVKDRPLTPLLDETASSDEEANEQSSNVVVNGQWLSGQNSQAAQMLAMTLINKIKY